MQAVDDNIRSKLHGRFREQVMHSEMRPVSLIHNQGQAESVDRLRDRADVTDNALITGGSDKNRADPGPAPSPVLLKGPLYILRPDGTVQLSVRPGIKINCFQAVQAGRVVCGFMAAAGHQNPSASPAAAGTDRGKDAAGAPVYQKMCLPGPVKLRRAPLCLQNHAFRVVQIIKAVYFRNIKGVGIRQGAQPSLVPRHVEGVGVGRPVPDQFFIQIHTLCPPPG